MQRDNNSVYVWVQVFKHGEGIKWDLSGYRILNLDTMTLDSADICQGYLSSKHYNPNNLISRSHCNIQDDGTEICTCINARPDVKPEDSDYHWVGVQKRSSASGGSFTEVKRLRFVETVHQIYWTRVAPNGIVMVSSYNNKMENPIICYDSRDDFKVKTIITAHKHSHPNYFGTRFDVDANYVVADGTIMGVAIFKFNSVARRYENHSMIPVDRSKTRSGLRVFNGVVSFTSHPTNQACEYFIEAIETNFNSIPVATSELLHDDIGKMRYGVGGIMFLPYPNTSGHVATKMASNTDYLVLLGSGILYEDGKAAHSIKFIKILENKQNLNGIEYKK